MFHQMIVGAAVTMFEDLSEVEARLFIMSWVAQGAFMTFTGVLLSITLFFHGLMAPAAKTTLLITSISLLLLGCHVLLSGYKTTIRPVRIGAWLEILNGLFILIAVIFFQFFN